MRKDGARSLLREASCERRWRHATAPATLGATLTVLTLVACGAGKPAEGPGPAASASASSSARVATPSPPPSGLPPMASMPPPGVRGSKVVTHKNEPALATCAAAATSRGRDPEALVKRVGDACASASPTKLKPVGAAVRGSQSDAERHQEHKLRVEAGRCYRVYVAADEAVKDLVVVLRDAAGDMIAEAPGAAAPEDGVACFAAAGEITLLVAVGAGKGAYAAQLWSD